MPELHEIMNIVADSAGSSSTDDSDSQSSGKHPRMPSIETIIGPGVNWVDHGRYHHARDDHIIHGFKRDYNGALMDRWWSMREPGQRFIPGFGEYDPGFWTDNKYDYAGYTMMSGLWGGEDHVKGADKDGEGEALEDVQTPFITALVRLSNVIPDSLNNLSSGKSENFHWNPTGTLIGGLPNVEDMFEDYGAGKDSNGYLMTAFQNLDVPEGPMTGAAASVFAAKIYHLLLQFQDMESQIRNNYNALKNIEGNIRGPANDMRDAVEDLTSDSSYTMQSILNNWYHTETENREIWNDATGQFWIRYKPGGYGPVSNPATDENVNNRLKHHWKVKFEDVINSAETLYKALNGSFESAHRSLRVIEPPQGGFPMSMISDIDDEDAPGGGGGGGGDIPDEITIKWDGDGPPGGGGDGDDIPDEITIKWDGDGPPDLNFQTDDDGPDLSGLGGGGGPDLSGLGGGDDGPGADTPDYSGGGDDNLNPGPPPYVPGPPPMSLNGPYGVDPGGFDPTAFGSEAAPSPGDDGGTPPPGYIPGAPPLGLNGPGGPGSDRRSSLPPPTALEIDPETGLPINPDTGRPFPVDPETGIPYHPDTGLPLDYDPVTGQVAPIDPVTGLPVTQDPPYLPADPGFGTNFPTAPESVYQNPVTGEPAEIDPETGLPYPIDHETGEAIREERPDPEPLNYPTAPNDSSIPFVSGGPPDLNFGGATPPPTSSSGPGDGTGSSGSGDRTSLFSAPEGVGGAPGAGGGPGALGQAGGGAVGPGGEGGASGQARADGHPPPMMPPMMPPMGGMGGGGGGEGGRDRNRTTWLSEDEKVWGTDKASGKAVLGRPVPGEKRGAPRHEFIDAGADGSRTGTSSNDDAGTRGRKRKPGVGNRRSNGQEQAGDGDDRRDRSSD